MGPLCLIASKMLTGDVPNITDIPGILKCFTNVMSNVTDVVTQGTPPFPKSSSVERSCFDSL